MADTWHAPLGYRNTQNKKGPSLVLDPAVAPLIRQAFDAIAAGRNRVRDVLRTVTALGLRTAKGLPLAVQSFRSVLRNPAYASRVVSPKLQVDEPGDFEAIVPEETFRTVQALLRGGEVAASPHRTDNPEFPLRRFVRCGVCQTPMTASASKGRSGLAYPYYHCRKGCRGMTVRKAELEDRFLEALQSLRLRSGYFELFREIVLDCWRTEATETQKAAVQLERRVSEIRLKLQRVEDRFLADEIDGRSYREMRDRLRYDLALAEIDRNDARLDETDAEGILAFAGHIMNNAAALWTNASTDDRKALQSALFPNGLVWDGAGFGTVTTSIAFSQLEGFNAAECRVLRPW